MLAKMEKDNKATKIKRNLLVSEKFASHLCSSGPPVPLGRRGRKKASKGSAGAAKIPTVVPNTKCKLRLLKLERIKDYMLLEQEFITNQELLAPIGDRNQVTISSYLLSSCY